MKPPRLPRRLYLVDRWVAVAQSTAEEMRDVVADHDGAKGAWDSDTETIHVLRTLSPREKWRVIGHEIAHALVDLLDRS